MNDDVIETPAEAAAEAPAENANRFTRAQLEAMHGRPGRKPAEYYELYPRNDAAPKAPKAPKAAKAPKAPKEPKAKKAGRPAKIKAEKAPKVKAPKIVKLELPKATRGRKPKVAPGGLVAKAKALIVELNAVLNDPIFTSYLEASDHDRRVISAALKATKG